MARAINYFSDHLRLPPLALNLTFFSAFWKLCSGFSFRASTLLNAMKSARSAIV